MEENTEDLTLTETADDIEIKPEPIEKMKKEKKPPKIKTEVKRKYNETYKMKKGIGEQLTEKIIRNLKNIPIQECPKTNQTEVIIKQEAPPAKAFDDTLYVKKEKYKKMKETLRNVMSEMEQLRNVVGSSKPKVNQMVYNELFTKR